MNRTRLLVIGIVALALGGLLSFAVYRSLQASMAPPKASVSVVVAAHDIPLNSRVQEQDLKLVSFPAGDLPPGVLHFKASAVGHGTVLPMGEGEFVLPAKLASGTSFAEQIPNGMRAVDVATPVGLIVPGNRVDVLVTDKSHIRTVLENVAVAATGSHQVVTLLASPEDAARVILAGEEGRIQLVLRNPLDKAQHNAPTISRPSLNEKRAKVVKVKQTAAPPSEPAAPEIQIIRGSQPPENLKLKQ